MKLETPYARFRVWLSENLKELAQIKEYPDTKSNAAMRVAVMNAEANTIQALMSVEEREANFFKTCADALVDFIEKRKRGEGSANQN